MPELTRWELSQARLALRAAILEGLKVVLKPGGMAVRGGQPSEVVGKLLRDHRAGILWHLQHQAAEAASVVRRADHAACARNTMPAEVDLTRGLR